MGSNIPFSASAQRTLSISAPTPYPYLTYAQSSPEFDPRLIPGCQLWLDGGDTSTVSFSSGSNVSTWTDKSGNGLNATVYAGTPTYTVASGITLNGSSSLQVSYPASPTLESLFVIIRFNSVSAQGDIFSGTASGQREYLMYSPYSPGTIYLGRHSTGPSGPINGGTVTTGTTYMLEYVFNGTGNTISFYQSGFLSSSGAPQFTYSAGGSISLIGSYNGGGYLQGQIYEMIVYNVAVTATQRQQIEGYLAKKWNLTATLSTQNIYAPGSYLTFVNAPVIPAIPMRRAVQGNKFLPPQYSNCVLWLDATDVNGTGRNPAPGTITSWTDKSGSGNSSTASGGTPTLTANSLNGRPGVAFSSASSSYIQVPRVVTSDWSIFIVFSTTQTGPNSTPTPGPGQAHTDSLANHWWAGQGIFDGEVAAAVNDMGISLCGSPTGYLGYGVGDLASGTDTTEFSAVAVNTGAGFIGEFFRTQSSGNLQMFVNGAFQVSTTGSTVNRISPTLKIGSIQTLPTGYFFTGNVYEIVCYSRVLSRIERQQIEGYFAWKWGLKASLTSSHPFFLIPPLPIP